METMDRIEQPIEDLIKTYPDAGRILHQLGVFFLQHPGKTLRQICAEQHIDPAKVIAKLNKSVKHDETFDLEQFPANLLVEYLRHTHYLFIKDRLPYITHLIQDYPEQEATEQIKELKQVFPEFAKELITHIYEEEDSLFAYIDALIRMQHGEPVPESMLDYSINHFADDHEHDDGMKGIRAITEAYATEQDDSLRYKTLMRTLKGFEEEYNIHAKVENDILFPKALKLEQTALGISS